MNHKFIPLSVPNFKGNELKYVTEAIESEWVSTGGAFIEKFEKQVAAYVKAAGAVACQNGSSGLHIALEICGVTHDDEVIVPTLTFIAAVNPVRYIGAEPIFMDCDDSLTMDIDKLQDFCETQCTFVDGHLLNKSTHKQVKAILIVHVFGNMADMERLIPVAQKYNLKVVEDATEAIGTYYTGGKYSGKYAGTIGNVGVYSFNGNKIITTGGGGMIVSDDQALLKRAKHLTTQAKSDELYYTHDEVGYNYRMTNLQAALGLAQLEQLETFIEIKKHNYNRYFEAIDKIQGLTLLSFRVNIRPNFWFYAVYCSSPYPLDRDGLLKSLIANNIQSRPIWGLIHEQKPYLNNQNFEIQKANDYLMHVINIPCSSNLTQEDLLYTIECLNEPTQ